MLTDYRIIIEKCPYFAIKNSIKEYFITISLLLTDYRIIILAKAFTKSMIFPILISFQCFIRLFSVLLKFKYTKSFQADIYRTITRTIILVSLLFICKFSMGFIVYIVICKK